MTSADARRIDRAKRLLRWSLRSGAVLLLRVRRKLSARPTADELDAWERSWLDAPARERGAHPAARLLASDPELRARFEDRFGREGSLAHALEARGRALVIAAERAGNAPAIAELVAEWQGEALRRALVERNRAALAKWARAKAAAHRAGLPVHELPAAPKAGRGRPQERARIKRLRELGLSALDAADLAILAGIRLPPPPPPKK